MNLYFGCGPAENALHLLHSFQRRATRFRNVRLLREVLRNQFLRRLYRTLVIMIYGAYDQLWTVNVVHIAPGFFRTNFYVLQGCVVVFWRHAIIEHDTI